VNAEFNVWLLIVGLVVGAGLVWVVMMDGRRQETDIDAAELLREAAWLSAVLAEDGHHVSPEVAEEVLLLHRAYLGAPPPDPVAEAEPADDDLPGDDVPGDDVPGDTDAFAPSSAEAASAGSEPAVEDGVRSERPTVDIRE
jgi:hypothetical protein